MRPGWQEILIIAVLLIVVFGWKRLPDAARSLGRSARVFKSEVEEMKKDGKPSSRAANETVPGQTVREPGGATPVTPVDPASRVNDPVRDQAARTDGNAVHENAPRTDNQSGPVA